MQDMNCMANSIFLGAHFTQCSQVIKVSGGIDEEATALVIIPLALMLAPLLAGLPDGALGPAAAVLLFPLPCLPER